MRRMIEDVDVALDYIRSESHSATHLQECVKFCNAISLKIVGVQVPILWTTAWSSSCGSSLRIAV